MRTQQNTNEPAPVPMTAMDIAARWGWGSLAVILETLAIQNSLDFVVQYWGHPVVCRFIIEAELDEPNFILVGEPY